MQMPTSLALVHHANQYLITNGYDNREGITDIVGSVDSGQGMAAVLAMHVEHQVPLNLHVSGTLLEAIAWHCPEFVDTLKQHLATGLIELIGSSYGQNILRYFGAEYNRKQLNEELRLFQTLLGADPRDVKVFWPPERVWETKRMAPVLRDAALLNDGYRHVILDDRTLLSPRDRALPRRMFDSGEHWTPEVFQAHEIERGLGLIALPIATRLRRSIPPKQDEDWKCVQRELDALLVHAAAWNDDNLLAVYADDMEKVIGVWGADGPARYTEFLEWVRGSKWIEAVKITEWARHRQPAGKRCIETGTFDELANEFEAGEGYEKWFHSEQWAPYRAHFEWAEKRVAECRAAGGDAALIELADKQLLVSNWETAWQTPATGAHGDPSDSGKPSPWARALTSHSRHAAVTAEAALWAARPEGGASAEMRDIDHDNEPDLVLRNSRLFALASPRWGGRIIALFSAGAGRGAMVIGNPCDDWNFLEDLNRFMETPRNHPGALADVGFENDEYSCEIEERGETVVVKLVNVERSSRARGLEKVITIEADQPRIRVRYRLPKKLPRLSVECALSPDYLELLRSGARVLRPVEESDVRGFEVNGVSVCVECQPGCKWEPAAQEVIGHGRTLRLGSSGKEFELTIHAGVVQAGEREEAA
jgi:hypothetical protein